MRPCQHPALVRGSGEHAFQGIRLICGIDLAPQEIQTSPLVDLGRVPQVAQGVRAHNQCDLELVKVIDKQRPRDSSPTILTT